MSFLFNNPQYNQYLTDWKTQNPNYGQPGYVGSQPLNFSDWQSQQNQQQQGNWWENPSLPWYNNQDAYSFFGTDQGQQWLQNYDQNTGRFNGQRDFSFQDSNGDYIDDRDQPWMFQNGFGGNNNDWNGQDQYNFSQNQNDQLPQDFWNYFQGQYGTGSVGQDDPMQGFWDWMQGQYGTGGNGNGQNQYSPWNNYGYTPGFDYSGVYGNSYGMPGMNGNNMWWLNMPPPWYQNGEYSDGSNFNGDPTSGARASWADYGGVQGFADQAYENARRYLDPQQEQDERRFEQMLINKGIDPNSEAGQEMYAQMMRAFGDQDQGAAFNALGFGQGIQDQMFRQNFMNTQQAGNMQMAQWANENNQMNRDLQRYLYDQNYNLGLGSLGLNSYLGMGNLGIAQQQQDLSKYLGINNYMLNEYLGLGGLDLQRQMQDWAEYMGYENIDFRNDQFNESNYRWDQSLLMQLLGFQPPYSSGAQGQVGNSYAPWEEWFSGFSDYWKNR